MIKIKLQPHDIYSRITIHRIQLVAISKVNDYWEIIELSNTSKPYYIIQFNALTKVGNYLYDKRMLTDGNHYYTYNKPYTNFSTGHCLPISKLVIHDALSRLFADFELPFTYYDEYKPKRKTTMNKGTMINKKDLSLIQ